MKKYSLFLSLFFVLLFSAGCSSNRLPSEDLEVLTYHQDLISVLKDPKYPPNSREKYEAARQLIRYVDLSYTRETKTIDSLLYYRDALIDRPGTDDPVFSFNYQYEDHYVRLRFFTYKMFVTRVEVTEK